jgi:hypothetical protein
MPKIDALLATIGIALCAVLAWNGFSVEEFLHRLNLLLIVE